MKTCWAHWLLWAGVLLLGPAARALSLPEFDDRSFIEECVREHNRARSEVNPPSSDMFHMTWDAALAITARAWARQCRYEHNIYIKQAHRMHPTFRSVGENLWKGWPPYIFNASRAIELWVDEKVDYNYEQKTCSKVCGHYTQAVWATTYKVGCAVQNCSTFAIFVCNYGPGGNIIGRHPYRSGGTSCQRCEANCEDKLCRNGERDRERSYYWKPDWDLVSGAAAFGYSQLTLSVRLFALSITFITAYTVHHCYPSVSCKKPLEDDEDL